MPLTGKPWTDKAIYLAGIIIVATLAWHVLRYYTGIPSLHESGAGQIIGKIFGLEPTDEKKPPAQIPHSPNGKWPAPSGGAGP